MSSLADRLAAASRDRASSAAGPSDALPAKAADRPSAATRQEDEFRDLKATVHNRLLQQLGPKLYDAELTQSELERMVRSALQDAMQDEDVLLTPADRTRIAPFDTTAGEVEVRGRIAPPPARLYEFDAAASGAIRQNLDLAAYAGETGLRLLPLSVMQERAPQDADDGLLREWPRPTLDVHKHYGYAFQWFALCALTAGLYVWFQLIRPWRQRRRHA